MKAAVTFKIPDDYVETPLDLKIKELRKAMKIDELKKLEEEKLKERLRLKEKELHEARKRKEGERILSYDLTGRLSEIATIPSIPSMMFSCGLPKIQQANPIKKEAKMTLRKTLIKPKTKSIKEATDIAMLIAESKKLINTTDNLQLNKAYTLHGVYDSLNPVAGVIFYEAGKNIKEANTTFKDKAGRITKSEFQTYLSEGSFNPNIGLSMNTSTCSNKFERTDKQIDYAKYPKRTGRVDVTGDLAQLWEGRDAFEEFKNKGEVSINPGMYVYPSKKPLVQLQDTQRGTSRTDIDLFNLTMTSGLESEALTARGPTKAIVLKNLDYKPSTPSLTSIVSNKRLVRERMVGVKNYGVKLPPPPLGRSKGHGL